MVLFVSLILKSQELHLNLQTLLDLFHFFIQLLMVSKVLVHGFELGVHATWFPEYAVHDFRGTGVQGLGT